MQKRASTFVWLLLYVICMSLVAIGMANARAWSIATFDTPEAQSDWDQWRNRARDESGQAGPVLGPVIRREPQSEMPPALMLMQDHFAACLIFSLILSSALFFTMMIAVRGAFGGASSSAQAE